MPEKVQVHILIIYKIPQRPAEDVHFPKYFSSHVVQFVNFSINMIFS